MALRLLTRSSPNNLTATTTSFNRINRSFSSSISRPSSPSTPSTPAASTLTWPNYLSLRRSQRRFGLVASIPTTFGGFMVGASYFATIEAEPTSTIMGLEPILAYAIATFSCVGLGWLSGPILGNQVWKLFHRSALPAMEQKDKDFYQHIVRNRVDPSRQSVSNPVPDYYGEKIGNLKQYRQWLRDQSAYKRKALFGSGSEESL